MHVVNNLLIGEYLLVNFMYFILTLAEPTHMLPSFRKGFKITHLFLLLVMPALIVSFIILEVVYFISCTGSYYGLRLPEFMKNDAEEEN